MEVLAITPLLFAISLGAGFVGALSGLGGGVVIIPVQDLLGLPSSARMNRPGTTAGNWTWRLPPGYPTKDDWTWLCSETTRTGRTCRVPDTSGRERNTVPEGEGYWE